MVCIAVTQNGSGQAWRFDSVEAARLHPIIQLGDPVLRSSEELLRSYGRFYGHELAGIVTNATVRASVDSAYQAWRDNDAGAVYRVVRGAVEAAWEWLTAHAPQPPERDAEVIRLIIEDRRAVEGATLRLRSTERKERKMTEAATTTKTKAPKAEGTTRAPRISDEAVIHMGKDKEGKPYDGRTNNPKRQGSKTYERFTGYRNGMTVKQAKEAGISAGDIAYDKEHGLITVSEGTAKAA